MIFLGPLYQFLATHFSDKINHFALVKLVITSLDKTIAVFLIFAVVRGVWLLYHKKKNAHQQIKLTRHQINREILLWWFVFYLMLLLFLTAFRGITNFLNLTLHARSLNEVNWQLFTETFKLTQGVTMFDFYYNLFGNIFWFIPFGMAMPLLLTGKGRFLRTFVLGLLLSWMIETCQFILYTGIADVDDLVFNTIGTLIGLLITASIIGLGHLKNKFKLKNEDRK